MSTDSFFGITDAWKSAGDSIDAFFSNPVGALAKGFLGGNQKSEVKKRDINYMPIEGVRDLTLETDYHESEDFGRIEAEWLERLKKFAGLNEATKDTEVQLGK